jgi:hypothetical protein
VLALLVVVVGALGASACGTTPAREAATSAPAADVYTPPAEGASSLIESVRGRRDAGSGQITIEGRLRLPEGTQIRVDVYRSGIVSITDPLARAELYLGPRGAFEVGPLKVPADSKFRVVITSDRPNASESGAHFEESAVVDIGS